MTRLLSRRLDRDHLFASRRLGLRLGTMTRLTHSLHVLRLVDPALGKRHYVVSLGRNPYAVRALDLAQTTGPSDNPRRLLPVLATVLAAWIPTHG